MTSFIFPVIFLLAGGQPPTDETTQQAAPAVTAAAPAAEPKMICKYEHVTGSRLSKQKVCRPEGQSSADQSTALQREMDKFGARPERAPGLGN
jgi:hypothetical protein